MAITVQDGERYIELALDPATERDVARACVQGALLITAKLVHEAAGLTPELAALALDAYYLHLAAPALLGGTTRAVA